METTYTALATEIGRVVNCAYPAALKSLRDILCSKSTKADIARWTLAKPCQIDGLVCRVLADLGQWPYILDIVARLSSDLTIRDTFLRHKSTLLHDLVSQAIKSHDVECKYTATAIAMLSNPLPSDVLLPSETQDFFVRIFNNAAHDPSPTTIKPVYQILKGLSTSLLELLSNETLDNLETNLFDMVRNIKGDNHWIGLYCLGIMNILSQTVERPLRSASSSYYDTQELLASTPLPPVGWNPEGVKQYFAESKAQKTTLLLVLRTMWACTASTGESPDEKIQTILLANEILVAVSNKSRETWVKTNTLTIRKLEEKVFAPTLDLNLRLQALCFLKRLLEGSERLGPVNDHFRHVFSQAESTILVTSCCAPLELDLIVDSKIFDPQTTTAFLQNIADFLTNADGARIIECGRSLIHFLQQLSNIARTNNSVVEGTILALDVLSCGSRLRALSRLVASPDAAVCSDICGQALRNTRNELVHALCKMVLTAALSSAHTEYNVPQETLLAILELHGASAGMPVSCLHARQIAQPFHSTKFADAESKRFIIDRGWREALEAHLTSRSRAEQETLTALFSKACASLESRCEDVERPLREEQEKNQELQIRYDELTQAYANLEKEDIDRNIRLQAVERERDQCLNTLEETRHEAAVSVQKVYETERNLNEIKSQAEKQMAEVVNKVERLELENACALAKQEEEVEELQHEVQGQAGELRRKMQELEDAKTMLEKTCHDGEAANSKIEELKRLNEEQGQIIETLRSEKSEMALSKDLLQSKLKCVTDKFSEQEESHRMAIGQLHQQKDDSLAQVKSVHTNELAEIHRQHQKMADEYSTRLLTLENSLCQSMEQHACELEKRASEAAERRDEIDNLTRKCEQKDKQIAEADAMRSNLMAAMGFGESMQPKTALPLRQTKNPSSRFSGRQEFGTQDTENGFSTQPDKEAKELVAGASFASNASSGDSRSGPAPKRPRPQGSLVESPPVKPCKNSNTRARNMRSSMSTQLSVTKRPPLLSVSANPKSADRVAHVKKTPRKGAVAAKVWEDENYETDGTEFLGGRADESEFDRLDQ